MGFLKFVQRFFCVKLKKKQLNNKQLQSGRKLIHFSKLNKIFLNIFDTIISKKWKELVEITSQIHRHHHQPGNSIAIFIKTI